MKKSARIAAFMAILLLGMTLENPEAFDSVASRLLTQPQPKPVALGGLQGIWPPDAKTEEGTIMEDYGYTITIGAESAVEPMYFAPSGYLAAEYDSRFALQAPVPEPETYTMLLVGAGLLSFKFRHKPLQS
jgi:hypothetical protein